MNNARTNFKPHQTNKIKHLITINTLTAPIMEFNKMTQHHHLIYSLAKSTIIKFIILPTLAGLLSSCITPSFNSGSTDYKIQTLAIDPKFPNLMAHYEKCIEPLPCGRFWNSNYYTLAYIDKENFADKNVMENFSAHLFTDSPYNALIPSYGNNAKFRILSSSDDSSNGRYQQMISFYHETPSAQSHRIFVKLPDKKCREPIPKSIYSDHNAIDRQKIAFSVINERRAFIFVSTSTSNSGCADITVSDVLGDVQGIPEHLKNVPYVVYMADLEVDKNSQHPTQYARRVTKTAAQSKEGTAYENSFNRSEEGIASESVKPIDTLILTADPIPNIDENTFLPSFQCHESHFAVDWNIFLGQAAKSRAMESVSVDCKKI